MKRNNLSLTEILDNFYIEDSKLKWKHDVKFGSWRRAGDLVGGISNSGYLRVGLKRDGMKYRTLYMVHRIMYQMYHSIELLEDSINIDHIDINPLNNSIENLRVATTSQNNCNNSIRSDNKTGHSNISMVYNRRNGSFSRYMVSIQKDRKAVVKYFKTLEEAIEWRDETRKDLHGEFSKKT